MLITFEGLPGAGKSTQATLLAQCLRDHGHPVSILPDLATLNIEPLAATLTELLRSGGDPFLRTGDAITDTLITAAIRADLVTTVLDPALAATPGGIVIEDRGIHTMASYAIASLLREHRAPPAVALDWLDALTTLAGPRPTLALWLRLPPDIAARRANQRNAGTDPPLTGEQRAYLTWVHHAYQLLTDWDPQLTVLDVTDLDPVQTHHAIHQTLDRIDHTDDIGVPACTKGRHDTAWSRASVGRSPAHRPAVPEPKTGSLI